MATISLQPRGQYCDFPPIIFPQNHTDRPDGDVLNMPIKKRACYFQPVLRPPRDHPHACPPTTSGQTRPLLPATLIHWRPFSMDTVYLRLPGRMTLTAVSREATPPPKSTIFGMDYGAFIDSLWSSPYKNRLAGHTRE